MSDVRRFCRPTSDLRRQGELIQLLRQRRRHILRRRGWPAAQVLETIDHGAEQLRGSGGIVERRVGLALTEADAGGFAGLGQYGLAIYQPGQGGGIEAGERVEGVAFDIGAFGCRVQKALIKKAVMPHQHRAGAAMLFDCLAHRFEHAFQGRFLGHGTPQRVVRLLNQNIEEMRTKEVLLKELL